MTTWRERGAVELHLHTCYSFLEGASQPEELAGRARALGYRALAITDHDGLHGAMAFALACAAADVRPITGVELTLRHGLRRLGDSAAEGDTEPVHAHQDPRERQHLAPADDADHDTGPVHLTLLAENERGYANLCRLVSLAHRVGRAWSARQPLPPAAGDTWLPLPPTARPLPPDALPPMLDPALLAGRTEGLIVLSGCRAGEASRLVDAGRLADAADALQRLAGLFGRQNTYVELQHNLVYGDTQRVARLAGLADALGLPCVATGNVHYHDRSRHRLQDALVAIKHRTTLEGSHRLRRPNDEFYLRPPDETAERFARYPAALAAMDEVADRCQGFNMADRRDLGYDFPDFTRQDDEQYASADEVLATYCWGRFWERYPADATPPDILERAQEQLAEELRLVAKHHLAGFFLIYRDLQRLATDVATRVRGAGTIRGASGLPPGRGRGSSVSSIICYLIGLSHVDPLRPGFSAARPGDR